MTIGMVREGEGQSLLRGIGNAATGAGKGSERSIGAILVDAGLLKLEEVERILRLQKEHGMHFGEAAVKLGLVSKEDIRFALSHQFDYPVVKLGRSVLAADLAAAYQPHSYEVETLRAVRSQLMLRWFGDEPERRSLAIVSAESGAGRSHLAANLAIVFSQLGEHTLLIDADMRSPRQHQLFGLEKHRGLSTILSGRSDANVITRIGDLKDLSVLPAGPMPPNPQELLSKPIFSKLLAELVDEFRIVIIDTPPADEFADAHTLAARAGAALLVARARQTRLHTLRSLADALTTDGAKVVGTLLNEF